MTSSSRSLQAGSLQAGSSQAGSSQVGSKDAPPSKDGSTANGESLFRALPSIGRVLGSNEGAALSARFGAGLTKLVLREELDEIRREITAGKRSSVPGSEEIAFLVETRLLRWFTPEGRRAINATGVLLHTGLGRAPLGDDALAAVSAPGYSIVQIELGSGGRSLREEKIERMLAHLTGCEAATVVNNNAAATFILLNTIARGREVIISRGQLIEIGGSYRMPDVMEQSGVILREVGTTNRTRLSDYEQAIRPETGALLFVHPSNYRIRGFASTPGVSELCELGRAHNLPVIADLGSGALVDFSRYGLQDAMTIADSMRAGVAATCSSGDKLICGPQAGIICGTRQWVEKVRKNPFMRMFRVDKLTLAALETTLTSYVNGSIERDLPLYRMLGASLDALGERADALRSALGPLPAFECTIEPDAAYVGGGSLPDEAVPSIALRLRAVRPELRNSLAETIASGLRRGLPSVFCRVQDEALWFNLRSVFDDEIGELAHAVRRVVMERAGA